MAIPELERRRVEKALDEFCDQVPPEILSELTYTYEFRGNAVTLAEQRPHLEDRTRHIEHAFAKFVYSPTVGGWSLRWRDRDGRRHAYEGFKDVCFVGWYRSPLNGPTGRRKADTECGTL